MYASSTTQLRILYLSCMCHWFLMLKYLVFSYSFVYFCKSAIVVFTYKFYTPQTRKLADLYYGVSHCHHHAQNNACHRIRHVIFVVHWPSALLTQSKRMMHFKLLLMLLSYTDWWWLSIIVARAASDSATDTRRRSGLSVCTVSWLQQPLKLARNDCLNIETQERITNEKNIVIVVLLGRRCYCIDGLIWSFCLSVVCRVMYCGETVQDRPIVCTWVERERGLEISIGSIFDPIGPTLPTIRGVELGLGCPIQDLAKGVRLFMVAFHSQPFCSFAFYSDSFCPPSNVL